MKLAAMDWRVWKGSVVLFAGEFEEKTVSAFRRLTLEKASAQTVASELGLTVAAVYMAKSRVLRRLRELAADLVGEETLA